jgi:hypothetical protein
MKKIFSLHQEENREKLNALKHCLAANHAAPSIDLSVLSVRTFVCSRSENSVIGQKHSCKHIGQQLSDSIQQYALKRPTNSSSFDIVFILRVVEEGRPEKNVGPKLHSFVYH